MGPPVDLLILGRTTGADKAPHHHDPQARVSGTPRRAYRRRHREGAPMTEGGLVVLAIIILVLVLRRSGK
ncbi:hypothetical protein ACFFKU_01340 [Kineococcus gynurae]|uniref:MYXO-CTERM domain-containing protein n=1 Tax=Kineococcus gynurae TaxID=452979 RepID=A0ABV5LQ36_9ACTN